MIQITKIFQFEMAHALNGYAGACRNIHGHSYELHVTVSGRETHNGYIPALGIIIDFKELKSWVKTRIVDTFDHKIVLSRDYITQHPELRHLENLFIMEAEPSAENLLHYMQQKLLSELPINIKLCELKLYETRDSYAKWICDNSGQ
jgi:6-pyruvoyltetrahydropterin/6-carboxytetrahydropterin synthase